MKRKGLRALAITLLIVCVFSVGVFAGDSMEEIKAFLNYGITIEYNDVDQVMTDANGNRVYPITYNGTTYLPVRAVSNMLGVKVEWDGATNHVLLGNSYPDVAVQPTVPTTPAVTTNQFDFTFVADAINTYGNGKIVLADYSAQYVDSNGIWQGKYWEGGTSGPAYTFPSLTFASVKGSGNKVAEMPAVMDAIRTALKSRGYILAKTDQFGMEHYVNGDVEFKLWNINNANTSLQIEVETSWQSCCAD